MALSPTAWTPETGLTYAEWLRDKSPQTRPQGWSNATRDVVREGYGKDGRRFKATTDQLGNDVVQHGADQQSVRIRSVETVHASIPASALQGSTDVQR
ncbi:hypothetical protein AB0F88_40065 [Streptosporangium sp. NPDC023963]|uniref:hypothetical protein n=1 Tax=Streptosporangium sp. NPDC023963 TaxID=3155608 RepID=UPI0034358A33